MIKIMIKIMTMITTKEKNDKKIPWIIIMELEIKNLEWASSTVPLDNDDQNKCELDQVNCAKENNHFLNVSRMLKTLMRK